MGRSNREGPGGWARSFGSIVGHRGHQSLETVVDGLVNEWEWLRPQVQHPCCCGDSVLSSVRWVQEEDPLPGLLGDALESERGPWLTPPVWDISASCFSVRGSLGLSFKSTNMLFLTLSSKYLGTKPVPHLLHMSQYRERSQFVSTDG